MEHLSYLSETSGIWILSHLFKDWADLKNVKIIWEKVQNTYGCKNRKINLWNKCSDNALKAP
jgi:hypothetical protein